MRIVTAARRAVARMAGSAVVARLLRPVLPVLDRLALRLSGNRWTVTTLVIPTLVLTTTGCRSGQSRHSPLCFVRDGDDLVVVGTNWGQAEHPAWTTNLLATPQARVLFGGRTSAVLARPVDGAERERLYAAFERLGPNYTAYRSRMGSRRPRMFRLTPHRDDQAISSGTV